MTKRTYEVTSPLRYGGKDYAEGDPIELTQEEASMPSLAKRIEKPGGKRAGSAVTQQQAAEVADRVKGDLEAAQAARDEAKADRDKAEADREAAAKDLEAAKAERAEAEKARDEAKAEREKAEADRKAAEEAAKKTAKK